jgi:hypothetical protein
MIIPEHNMNIILQISLKGDFHEIINYVVS